MVTSALPISFLAGVLSTLSPCVLPLLPILIGGAFQQHRWGPTALAIGLIITFTAFGLFVSNLGFAANLDPSHLRKIAAALMAGFGAVMFSATLQRGFARISGPIALHTSRLLERVSGDGLSGQFFLGLLLGLVWSPCAGPSLGAAIGMATNSGTAAKAAATMAVFSLGAATPLLALAYGSRRFISSQPNDLMVLAKWLKPLMAVGLMTIGLLIMSGFDKVIETALNNTMPDWLVDVTTRF